MCVASVPAQSTSAAIDSGEAESSSSAAVAEEEAVVDPDDNDDDLYEPDEETQNAIDIFAANVPEKEETSIPFCIPELCDIASAFYAAADKHGRSADGIEGLEGLKVYRPSAASPAPFVTHASSSAPAPTVNLNTAQSTSASASHTSFASDTHSSPLSPPSERTLQISQEKWERVAMKVLTLAFGADAASPHELGRYLSAYVSEGVVYWNWATLEEAAGAPMNPLNKSWTVSEGRTLGFDNGSVSVVDVSIKKYTNKLTGKRPMTKDVLYIRVWNFLSFRIEKLSRLELGHQKTLIQGRELESLWDGVFDSPKELAAATEKLLPLLHELYGAEHYERLRYAQEDKLVLHTSLDFAGGSSNVGVCAALEKLDGQAWSQASVTIYAYSMAAILSMGFQAVLNIVCRIA